LNAHGNGLLAGTIALMIPFVAAPVIHARMSMMCSPEESMTDRQGNSGGAEG